MQNWVFVGIVVLGLGCGGREVENESDVAEPSYNAYAVATTSDLPPCDEARRGQLYFIEEDKRFRVCHASGWAVIDLTGPRGATGTTGAVGATGAQGANATVSSFVALTAFCNGHLTGTGLYAIYDVTLFRTGDVFASASIRDASIEISASSFYASAQQGAVTAPVFLLLDVDGAANSGNWRLELDRKSLVVTVTYTDSDSPGGMRTWTKPASECVLNVY